MRLDKVNARDNGICISCGRETVWTNSIGPNKREYHHLVPVGKGGKDSTWNVATLCLDCHVKIHSCGGKDENEKRALIRKIRSATPHTAPELLSQLWGRKVKAGQVYEKRYLTRVWR